jgi:hypothetical protein
MNNETLDRYEDGFRTMNEVYDEFTQLFGREPFDQFEFRAWREARLRIKARNQRPQIRGFERVVIDFPRARRGRRVEPK